MTADLPGAAPGLLSRTAALASLLGALAVVWIGWAVARQALPADPGAGGARSAKSCRIPGGGYLQGDLYGGLRLNINFRNEKLHCEGMLRPDDGGIRLMFAGIPPGSDGDQRLVLVLGIDGQLASLAGAERFTNVTLIDERDGRFFNARDTGRCFSAIRSAEPIEGSDHRQWRIEGDLYCAGALPSLQGMDSVTLGTLRYAGRLDVDAL